jgi:hypothetical protein
MDDDQIRRNALLLDVRRQNSALERLIETTSRLIANSRKLLRRLQGEVAIPPDSNRTSA